MTFDPVTLAVIQNGLQQVCNEMDLAFVRAAFSPVISEALDRSDGIYHRDTGELIAQARELSPQITTQVSGRISLENVRAYAGAGADLIQVGALTQSVRAMDISFQIQVG